MPSRLRAISSRIEKARASDCTPPRRWPAPERIAAMAGGRSLPPARCSARVLTSDWLFIVAHRRGYHQKYQIDEPGVGYRVLDAGRQEDEVVLAHDVVLAGDVHQSLAFDHVI